MILADPNTLSICQRQILYDMSNLKAQMFKGTRPSRKAMGVSTFQYPLLGYPRSLLRAVESSQVLWLCDIHWSGLDGFLLMKVGQLAGSRFAALTPHGYYWRGSSLSFSHFIFNLLMWVGKTTESLSVILICPNRNGRGQEPRFPGQS